MAAIFDKTKVKELKRKTKAVFECLTSLNYVNELLMWSKQLLISNDVSNVDNSKEILNKANKLYDTIYNYLKAQLELTNKWNDSVSFLIDCESLFSQDDYMNFRVYWSELLNIIHLNSKDDSKTKIHKLSELSKFWRKYLLKSQDLQIES
ncbi:hypothetical protein [Malacoplasma muris]|uniref:hypothetical protein n=1 Tax=Malacoplasma muris TaxID=2119 RepID=UPI00398EEE96